MGFNLITGRTGSNDPHIQKGCLALLCTEWKQGGGRTVRRPCRKHRCWTTMNSLWDLPCSFQPLLCLLTLGRETATTLRSGRRTTTV
jgi:hypothetical protein